MDNLHEIVDKIVTLSLQAEAGKGLEPISKILLNVYEQISQAAKSINGLSGLKTGYGNLDRFIMGFNCTDLIILASRPGMGKTSLALNIAMNVVKTSGKATAFFASGISNEQLVLRLLSSESSINVCRLREGKLTLDEWRCLADAAKSVSEVNLLISDDTMPSIVDIVSQCCRIQNLALVIIDCIQDVQSIYSVDSYTSAKRTVLVSGIISAIKAISKELRVPILCISQLPQTVEMRKNKRPLMTDFRHSGSLAKEADVILGLYRDNYYNCESNNSNIAECIILKNRWGETGTVELKWEPECLKYSSLD